MFSKAALVQVLLTPGSIAIPVYPTQPQQIHWGPCPSINHTLPIHCANFTVPLDYTDLKSEETVTLELLKVSAIHGPSKGSILMNFGGPGLPGRANLAGRGKQLQLVTGGHHDIITWDPRGTGNTFKFSCYATEEERQLAALTPAIGFGNASEVMLGRIWAASTVGADACFTNTESKERGSMINTPFSARDMMQIVDAVEEDGLLRYWGLSYGTALGATAVAMFPDRIKSVVLDGVFNPQEYYNSYDIESWSDTDETFSEFFRACVKSPDKCLLARNNATAMELEAATYDLIYKLKFQPVTYEGLINDYTMVKALIRPSLYSIYRWPALGKMLDGLLSGNLTNAVMGMTEIQTASPAAFTGGVGNEAPFGIHCGDKKLRASSLNEVKEGVDRYYEKSKLLGDSTTSLILTCVQWKIEPKERYQGNFRGIRTKNPVLVIGNTWDSATSIDSARTLSAGIEGSVVLEQNGHGHCTQNQPSICTSRVIANFFLDGKLPEAGKICPIDSPAFSGITWDDVLPQL